MGKMDDVAITARTMAIALLAPPFALTAIVELRTVPDGRASRRAKGREEWRVTGRRA